MSGAFAELHQDLRDLVGQIIADRYRVDSLLGVGGMAAVFRAHHLGLKRDVALKVLHPNLTVNREISARFDREAESASRLDHPNTIQVTDYGSTPGGMKFMVMQLLEGRELGELLVRPLPARRAVELMLQIFRGLEHAHRQGVVHRDIKPENIFLTTGHDGQEVVKLVDFGISKIVAGPQTGRGHQTSAGLVFGTPAYMSPEQAAGMEADGRADLYAAGIILYQMLSGRLPFDSDDPVALIRMQVGRDAEPLPHSVPPLLAGVVDRLLAKDRERRFQSATEVIDTLEGLLPLLDGGLAVSEAAGSFGARSTPAPTALPSGSFMNTPSGRFIPTPGGLHSPSSSYPAQLGLATGPHGTTGNVPTVPVVHARWPLWTAIGGLSIAVIALAVVFVRNGSPPQSGAQGTDSMGQAEGAGGSTVSSAADPAVLAQVDQLILSKEFDKAEGLLKPLRDQYPDDPTLLWRQGRIFAASKRKQSQALAAYGQALGIEPKLLDDRDFYAETYELLRTRRLRDEALDLALQKMGRYAHTFLLELVNDVRSPMDYHDRQRALEELAKAPENEALVDRRLNMALNLLQAHKSMTPCRSYLDALEEIEAAPDYFFFARVEKAKVPTKPGPGIVGAGSDDPEACFQLDSRRQEVLTMLGAMSPDAGAASSSPDRLEGEEDLEIIEVEEEPAATPPPSKRRKSSAKKADPDCKKFGALFNKKCRG